MKRHKTLVKKKFGMNKGVGHAIRRPDLKKLRKKKLLDLQRQERIKKLEEAKQDLTDKDALDTAYGTDDDI